MGVHAQAALVTRALKLRRVGVLKYDQALQNSSLSIARFSRLPMKQLSASHGIVKAYSSLG